jgi:hypothetical protein
MNEFLISLLSGGENKNLNDTKAIAAETMRISGIVNEL